MLKILFMNKAAPYGGPGTFQTNIERFLKKNGVEIIYPDSKISPDIIFIISGTKKIGLLLKYKFKGVKIIQRLDGMNWRHKVEDVSFLFKLKCEIVNFIIAFIRRFIANHIIYQSKYIKDIWNSKYGTIKNSSIIYNGSNNNNFKRDKTKLFTITCVEGNIQEDELTFQLIKNLGIIADTNPRIGKIELYGNCSKSFIEKFSYKKIRFMGLLERDKVLDIYKKNYRIYFLLELNPPCPNSLIEALMNETPALGYDSGAFKEIVGDCGIIMPYHGKATKLDLPDFSLLEKGIDDITENYQKYILKCINVKEKFCLETMNALYFNIINQYSK